MTPLPPASDHFRLLENGEEYFPCVFDAIARARESVLLETFILFEDEVGHKLHAALLAAARRGVRVALTVDGFGSHDLSPAFIAELVDAGVQFCTFSPRPRLFGVRTHIFRRMHRKLIAVDAEVAFVGGLNFSAQHLYQFGPLAKQDYAVEIRGPFARQVHDFLVRAMPGACPPAPPMPGPVAEREEPDPRMQSARASLVTRDNHRHRNDIEFAYLDAIRAARREVIIANAYFLPGYRLLHALCEAAARGVRVRLLLQGKPDMPWVARAGGLLYAHLQDAGVQILEYVERPFHGKVAVVDDNWATVGSSNLDPLSLSLNLEANLVIRDEAFACHLRGRLEALIGARCRAVPPGLKSPRNRLDALGATLMFHFLRRFPAWAGWLPAHAPRLVQPMPGGRRNARRVVVLRGGAE
ncbi:putative Cardiolipin synthetase, Phospholipase D/nuclease superfamily [Cupriavidus taiwanensis]|uniref:Cardiolipin synthase B n=1 Tax=Cupriavidus taiwanensis TaxID=164546 RepID=A0A976AZ84_9BURK|nr:cardiolipin synthase ClsB [Cupriavidus taiwanensis]SOZ61575.1 putative Cardiolipin synthetase, Phospholipase D/nuclease superfamily [Cupriavidus taiwanensis]SOZ65907.1 putative Cardiolipin synthetase, Phospholipase D/nuclease superfamily [Cupriavidus taiwanensis]SOZ67524.1 putative Cardiolipin synthetase, Phospholipase D/nuclease superfamily [Cupriavidus taiwanensis]SPA02440.1 putative Cardiolipin synthetase, Phospholipase D/nuclease superfamily [Cupriavidus taiwanensis]SPA07307.1 putative 